MESRYALAQGAGAYGFALAGHDPRRPLVIDPGLEYSTYLGGSGFDEGTAIAVDPSGNAYVTGTTRSTNFPTTPGALDTAYSSGPFDAFVTKLDPTGSGLVYSTFLGGGFRDKAYGIAVDESGSAYVTGETFGSFPTTAGAYDTTSNGSTDAFITKLTPDGSALDYSTYLGLGATDFAAAIAVDGSGNAYVAGGTSGLFPTTAGAYDTAYNSPTDDVNNGFVTKLNATGSALVYSTYLGAGYTSVSGIAVDAGGNGYAIGTTLTASFPTTPGAFDTTFNCVGCPSGYYDGFVTKLNPAGSTLVYSSFLGGSHMRVVTRSRWTRHGART